MFSFFSDMHTAIAGAAAAGSFTALLLSKGNTWASVLTYFAIGQMTAFYFTVTIADDVFGLGPDSYGWIGFSIGVIGILFWGGVIKLFENLRDDPKGTLTWAFTLWKGRAP